VVGTTGGRKRCNNKQVQFRFFHTIKILDVRLLDDRFTSGFYIGSIMLLKFG
jgi:hypothetical protein